MPKVKFSKDVNGMRVVVGDKVVALNSCGFSLVKRGGIYTVLEADEDGVRIAVDGISRGLWMTSYEIAVVSKVSDGINAGDTVALKEGIKAGRFSIGEIYKVKDVYLTGAARYIKVERDDEGGEGCWLADFFYKVEEDTGMDTVTDRAGNEVKVGDVVTALTDGGFSCIVPYRNYKVDYTLPHGVGIFDEGTRKSWFMTPDEILLVKQEDEIMRLEQNETVAALKEVVSKLDEMLVVLKGTETASELDEEPKRVAMPDWKEGDKVRCLKDAYGYKEGEVYEVGYSQADVADFGILTQSCNVLQAGCLASNAAYYVNKDILDYFELLEEAQEPEKKGRSVKFKVGDKVRIREGFDVDGYNSTAFQNPMSIYFNKKMLFDGVRTIHSLDGVGDYMFEGGSYYYTDNMLELA